MKRSALCSVAFFLSIGAASAAHDFSVVAERKIKTEIVPLDVVKIETGYVFESDLNHGGSFGKQDALQNSIEYAHRFRLSGNVYLRLGLAYNRFDFGSTAAPVPLHLQSAAAIVAIDYMHGKDLGAFLMLQPGFYTEDKFDISSFDMPITAGRIFVLRQDNLYLFAGARASFLRGGFPVLPLLGLIWTPNEQWHVMAMLPEPRVVYSPNKVWDFWLGGEIAGGSFRTDRDENIQPRKLVGAQVDYEEYRTGGGVIYSPCDQFSFDLGAGYVIERGFKFHRAGENFRTDPAPFLRLQVKAKF